ncbi:MAG: hypothetical protein ACK4TA_21270 [Saprospiraceae bacterium]
MNTFLQKLQQGDLQDFTGTQLHLEIPLRIGVLNQMISEAIADVESIREVKITQVRNGEVTIVIHTNILTFKERIITGRVLKNLEFPNPTVRIQITDGLGFTGRKLVSMALPDGMELDGKELCISLNQFIFKAIPYSEVFLRLATRAEVETREKDFLVRLDIQK